MRVAESTSRTRGKNEVPINMESLVPDRTDMKVCLNQNKKRRILKNMMT